MMFGPHLSDLTDHFERTEIWWDTTSNPTAGAFHQCGHCGQWHYGQCPRIKNVTYHPNGAIKSVEYHK